MAKGEGVIGQLPNLLYEYIIVLYYEIRVLFLLSKTAQIQ